MFYHRILPPPSNLAKAPVAGVKPPNGDTLLENRIIMSENQRLHTDRRQSQIQQHTPSFSDEQVQRAEDDQVNLSGGYATRSSARLSRKRDSDPSPEESSQLSRNRVASVSGEGPGTKLAESPSQLCLCQPDPKVPRPRNGENQICNPPLTPFLAFILFRQHHQAAVVAQNPGLANPDISKIIGDAWRSSSSEVKNHWKRLADVCSVFFSSGVPLIISCSGGEDTPPEAIPGLSIPATTSREELRGQFYHHGPRHPTMSKMRSQQNGGNGSFSRPSRYISSPPPPHSELARVHPGVGGGPLAFRNAARSYPETFLQVTPDLKRRRLENPYNQALPRTANGPMPPPHSQSLHRASMSRTDLGLRNPSLAVQRPHATIIPPQLKAVALAPLRLDETKDSAAQAKAVEAMVMSIPAINKIKLLAKISPPLPAPSPASPPHATRGALLAIEGNDEEAIKNVVNYLKDYLERDSDYRIRVYSKPAPTRCETISEWMKLMRSYHEQAEEIIKYITTVPGKPNANAQDPTANIAATEARSNNSSPVSPKSLRSSKKQQATKPNEPGTDSDNGTGDGDTEMQGTNPNAEDPSGEAVGLGPPDAAQSRARPPSLPCNRPRDPIPIALVPKYQLTLTDAAASIIPILDEYSPTDHWQWMATLWRGIVGPDVTVD
ncbi:MAG: hypothetical protein LQ340_002870, partial [Diploschistes diacapsis]